MIERCPLCPVPSDSPCWALRQVCEAIEDPAVMEAFVAHHAAMVRERPELAEAGPMPEAGVREGIWGVGGGCAGC